ncbi:hypothetical protein IVB11_29865 [Bradyrhizobium sp. 177]|uniref:hypothetical protein n=1 Tax=Bradyrhizobium sp. 177 TaxID=2782647 RepID=UPI001FF746FC|nr:hypothetical protein [Bradyrhizobium sp. 177]MCK1553133.1 hypothetical protein [Bradyrhizobium sp. 177]
MAETDNRALHRALAIERISRKLLARRLRGFMKPADFENYLEFVRSEAAARCGMPARAKATEKFEDAQT